MGIKRSQGADEGRLADQTLAALVDSRFFLSPIYNIHSDLQLSP